MFRRASRGTPRGDSPAHAGEQKGGNILRRTATRRPPIEASGRHALAAAVGAIGFLVTLLLLARAFDVPLQEPATSEEPTLSALLTLGAGTASGAVLLAGRRVSPAAPLTSGLLWAVGSLLSLADPALLSASILPVVGYQLGLALAAMMLLGTLAVQPTRLRQRPPSWSAVDGDTDPNLPVVRPDTVHRTVARRRPDGTGPRHRAGREAPRVPARRAPVPDQRRMPQPPGQRYGRWPPADTGDEPSASPGAVRRK